MTGMYKRLNSSKEKKERWITKLECIKGWIQVKKRRKDEMLNLNVYKDEFKNDWNERK